jgi:Mg2+ and Co2+ transporter CorA
MTFGVINTSIKSMIKAYTTTFTSAFWEGKHQTLWPHPDPDSPGGQEYRAKLAPLRMELESVLRELRGVQESNENTRQVIQSLRDQLFAGSSIMEARRAIDQGDNIRILTLSSMIFLPLTFVTVSHPSPSILPHPSL